MPAADMQHHTELLNREARVVQVAVKDSRGIILPTGAGTHEGVSLLSGWRGPLSMESRSVEILAISEALRWSAGRSANFVFMGGNSCCPAVRNMLTSLVS